MDSRKTFDRKTTSRDSLENFKTDEKFRTNLRMDQNEEKRSQMNFELIVVGPNMVQKWIKMG